MQTPGTYRLGQGVAPHPQLIGDVGGFPTRIKSLLGRGELPNASTFVMGVTPAGNSGSWIWDIGP